MLDSLCDALSLGFGEPIPISSAHGDGMADLVGLLYAAAERRGIPYVVETKVRGTAPAAIKALTGFLIMQPSHPMRNSAVISLT